MGIYSMEDLVKNGYSEKKEVEKMKVVFDKDESINILGMIEDCIERGMIQIEHGVLKASDTIKRVDQLIAVKGYNGTNLKITIEFD